MLIHLILNYNMKTEVEGVRPSNIRFGAQVIPDRNAKALFRNRGP